MSITGQQQLLQFRDHMTTFAALNILDTVRTSSCSAEEERYSDFASLLQSDSERPRRPSTVVAKEQAAAPGGADAEWEAPWGLQYVLAGIGQDDARIVSSCAHTLQWANFSRKELTIVIKGSSDVKDWMLNLTILPVWDAVLGTRVHAGFRARGLTILALVKMRLKTVAPRDGGWRLKISGYSLGAAAALIASEYLRRDSDVAAQLCEIEVRAVACPSVFWGSLPTTRAGGLPVSCCAVQLEVDAVDVLLSRKLAYCENSIRTLVVSDAGSAMLYPQGRCSRGVSLSWSRWNLLYTHVRVRTLRAFVKCLGVKGVPRLQSV